MDNLYKKQSLTIDGFLSKLFILIKEKHENFDPNMDDRSKIEFLDKHIICLVDDYFEEDDIYDDMDGIIK